MGVFIEMVIIKVIFYECLKQKAGGLRARPQLQRPTPGGEMALCREQELNHCCSLSTVMVDSFWEGWEG